MDRSPREVINYSSPQNGGVCLENYVAICEVGAVVVVRHDVSVSQFLRQISRLRAFLSTVITEFGALVKF